MKKADFLTKTLIAHRGLYNINKGIVENTLEAFKGAIDKKYIIELDVRLTKDDEVVVFHDKTLKRMAGIDKKIKDISYKVLKKQKLLGKNAFIPKLSNVLNLVKGKVPLLIEIKAIDKTRTLEKKVSKMLEKYKGQYAIQSFNPFTLMWFKKNKPKIIRGQLVSHFKKIEMNPIKRFVLKNMLFNVFSKPDFISYNIRGLNKKKIQKIRKKRILLGWTVKTKEEYKEYEKKYDNLICEKIL